ncbi:glycogen debranching protein GlgX [Roseateles sp.]|uniref:glycogen debranching protein GlgX n=1 Tax=Roseateles sp. TaxID=1971397 RepID=UPI00286ABB01|nr:glycogen debranching protein GlgX [Roseateles sp.]
MLPTSLLPGRHEPLGATPRDGGVNFAVFSENASRIELCIFDAAGQGELRRYDLPGQHDGVFHGFLPELGPGLVYGLRAHGPYAPEHGHRFNPDQLLLDPYAREIVGPAQRARVAATLDGASSPRLNAPRHATADLVLYEVHVKGFSMQHPDIPATLRGSYAGLAHPAAIAHFKALGVTTLSLLPVQYRIDEPHLAKLGLPNYWGYNTLGFFCPDPRLAQAQHRDDPSLVTEEFRAMVRELHAHGLEVVLDVVYNHTPEGNEFGPTLSLRGLDNSSYYRLEADDKSRYENLSACGNTLNCEHPRVTQMVLDSLRYWVAELGVDGFRFDLAPVLGRTAQGFDPNAAFFTALRQDPVLAGVHLISEPWDAGPGGYQVGCFPGRFLDWNDKFRDAVRGYWLGTDCPRVGRDELARRFTASSDLFHHGSRRPSASVNFVSVHDGYVLADVVSYSRKHNLANGENNRDGRDGELCANFGAEGPADDLGLRATRLRVRRAMLATLLLAQGTPMLCAGDEFGNSQGGNNNAYCQDNPTTWLSWGQAEADTQALVAELLRLRRQEPLLRHDAWFAAGDGAAASLRWFTPTGAEMQQQDWAGAGQQGFAAQMFEAGAAQPRLLIVFNPDAQALAFGSSAGPWRLALDSSAELPVDEIFNPGQTMTIPARSLVLLRHD